MSAYWRTRLLLLWCVAGYACGERAVGGSLRSALEALQRRQRARADRPHSLARYREPQDYEETSYDLYGPSPQYEDEPYGIDMDRADDVPEKDIVKYLNEQQTPDNYYDYQIKKKKSQSNHDDRKAKPSAFRERSLKHHNDNEKLLEIFDRTEDDEKNVATAKIDNDAEYAILLEKLWSKYKSNHPTLEESPPEGVVKLYKERNIKKRQYTEDYMPRSWGPIAFKRKRSLKTDITDEDSESDDYPDEYNVNYRKIVIGTDDDSDDLGPGFNRFDFPVSDKSDLRDEYAIALQPLDGDEISNLPANGDAYTYDVIEKRFPVAKRSGGLYKKYQIKRSTDTQDVQNKEFRGGSGTDPKVIRDLSKIFGEPRDDIKLPVKRSNKHEDNSHETKPPQVTVQSHNSTHDHNLTHIHDDESHESHGIHHPGLSGKEEVAETYEHSYEKDNPISLKKKSIDWSQYFGIDKRDMKSLSSRNDASEKFRKQYMDTFNEEVAFPLIHYQKNNKVKRDFIINKPSDESEFQLDSASAIAIQTQQKRNVNQQDDSKLDNIDRKLKGMESVIVDEAVHLSNFGDDIDTEEEKDIKEKMLSRLAAAYSLEKMRKALREFKQSLHTQKDSPKSRPPSVDLEESKKKRIAVKKEKAELKHDEAFSSKRPETEIPSNDEFEGEQGAGHYLNGVTEEPFSEGYMGGSGRHRAPIIHVHGGKSDGKCPVLDRIVQRCRGIDLLAGDQGQLFLPLCSLHQICYLCGQSAPTTCDLIFLSEADTSCDGDTVCQKAARGTLMAMRELHDSLADDLDGECEVNPCLTSHLRLNFNWNQVVKR